MDDRHPFVVFGGGPDEFTIHDPNFVVPREDHLFYPETDAKYVDVATRLGSPSDTHKLYYEVVGEGPKKMLFIMGLGGSHLQWAAQFEHFSAMPSEYQLCVYDNRCVGFSDVPTARNRSSDLANDALQLVEHLGATVDPRWRTDGFHLVGVSMGGMIALELALSSPTRIKSLSLFSTHAGGVQNTLPPLEGLSRFIATFGNRNMNQVAMISNALELLFPVEWLDSSEVSNRFKELKIPPNLATFNLTPNRYFAGRELLLRNRKFIESSRTDVELDCTITSIVSQIPVVATHYVSWSRLAHLGSMKIPTLVLHGAKDVLVAPRNAKMLAEELDATLLFYEDAGHGANDQYSTEVNAALEDVVNRGELEFALSDRPSRVAFAPRTHPYMGLSLVVVLALALRHRFRSSHVKPTAFVALIASYVVIKRFANKFKF